MLARHLDGAFQRLGAGMNVATPWLVSQKVAKRLSKSCTYLPSDDTQPLLTQSVT
jgi:hypothetical protein